MKLLKLMILHTNFLSGFCFQNESELFKEYLQEGAFCVGGFSYGAQKAFEYALNSKCRIDTLQLFSPAFFQNKDEKYKRLQLMFFKKDAISYYKMFLDNVFYGSSKQRKNYFLKGAYEELDDLLNYTWEKVKMEKLIEKGTKIEVFLGEKDKIINSQIAYEFFKEFACVYYIKDVGHIL